MAIVFQDGRAVVNQVATGDDVEPLLEWLQANGEGAVVDLRSCTHLHAAALQVLIAARPVLVEYPNSEELSSWLRPALALGERSQ